MDRGGEQVPEAGGVGGEGTRMASRPGKTACSSPDGLVVQRHVDQHHNHTIYRLLQAAHRLRSKG
jgi:hypothetical protein